MSNSVSKLPILGNINLPIRLFNYRHKKDSEKFFQSGFAFFRVADDQADVTGANDEDLGTLGGCMGGHYQINKHGEEESINVIIDVEDLWNLVTEMLETKNVRIKLEGVKEIYDEYWKEHQIDKKERLDQKKRLEEIRQMQKESEEEAKKAELEKEEAEFEKMLAEERASRIKEGTVDSDEKVGNYQILNNKGWDLSKELPSESHEYEDDFKFDPYRGAGVQIMDEHGEIYQARIGDTKVNLDISTWRGTSFGAIHYYAVLNISHPSFENIKETGTFRSVWSIPFFNNYRIEMTHVLEQWEIDKYPENYKGWRPGSNVRGFYTQEQAIRAGKEFFEKHFDPDEWELQIDACERTDNSLDFE